MPRVVQSTSKQLYTSAISLNPSYASAHHWYSLLLSEMGRTGEALAESQLAVETSPRSPVILAARADLLRKAGRVEEAEVQYKQASDIDPTFQGIRAQFAKLKLQDFKWTEALAEAEQAIETDPKDLKAVATAALTLTLMGEGAKADRWIDQLPPDKTPTRVAQLLRLRRRFLDLLKMQMSPDAKPAQIAWVAFQQGVAHTCMGQFKEATALFAAAAEKVGRTDSGLALWIAGRRAIACLLAGQVAEGELHRTAVERFTGDTRNRLAVTALIAFAKGDSEQGFEDLEQAIEQRCPWLIELAIEPLLDPFRDGKDPRYLEALRQIGFPS